MAQEMPPMVPSPAQPVGGEDQCHLIALLSAPPDDSPPASSASSTHSLALASQSEGACPRSGLQREDGRSSLYHRVVAEVSPPRALSALVLPISSSSSTRGTRDRHKPPLDLRKKRRGRILRKILVKKNKGPPPRFEGDMPRYGDMDGYRGGPRGAPGDFAGEKGGAPAEYQPAFRLWDVKFEGALLDQ